MMDMKSGKFLFLFTTMVVISGCGQNYKLAKNSNLGIASLPTAKLMLSLDYKFHRDANPRRPMATCTHSVKYECNIGTPLQVGDTAPGVCRTAAGEDQKLLNAIGNEGGVVSTADGHKCLTQAAVNEIRKGEPTLTAVKKNQMPRGNFYTVTLKTFATDLVPGHSQTESMDVTTMSELSTATGPTRALGSYEDTIN